ncbi:DUF6458 family protein [Conexibacter sp. SYSU D00693]|uniref:DUF6458 family protein n=1 Tax=Conexibacter sp. SYSU D00693 TaxID=2812560 RepID=UPI00196A2B1A|nr:DUF6458 family protein [Conexibacter sp. SYSU D00693]
MTMGTSVFLIALGAILRYAVEDAISGVNLATVGLILMIAGIVGIVLSFLMMAMARDRRAEVVHERRTVDPYARP